MCADAASAAPGQTDGDDQQYKWACCTDTEWNKKSKRENEKSKRVRKKSKREKEKFKQVKKKSKWENKKSKWEKEKFKQEKTKSKYKEEIALSWVIETIQYKWSCTKTEWSIKSQSGK